MAPKSLAQLTLHAIGGGWGDEQPGAGKVRVAVIRGTDIPRLRIGDLSSVPFRFESESKVRSRLLQDGDLVVEVSGGSAASGQHTGRALHVTTEILGGLGGNVIPASFCRLLRLDVRQVHPGFVVRQIDSLHQTGEIAEFENQSTGIANFQFNRFIEETRPFVDGLDAQIAVAECLSSFDQLISLNRRINQTLEAMAQAIFKSWFVDFDPVKAKIAAKAEGRDPLLAAMTAISGKPDAELDTLPLDQFAPLAATAALFPDEMEDSELGEIPKGWKVNTVGQLLELAYGKALKATDRVDGPIPVYGSGGVTGSHNVALVNRGSVIVGRKGTVGSLYWEDGPFFPIDTTFYVRPIAAPMTYCFYLLQTLGLEKMNTDAAVPGLNRENVYRLEHVLPSSTALKAFDSAVGLLRSAMRANTASSTSLSVLRDTLLPKLLSGELQVHNTDAEAAA